MYYDCMAATRFNIQGSARIDRGSIFVLTLTFSSDGTPIDITGWTFTGQIREEYDSPDAPLASFIFEALAETGKLKISLTPEQTGAFPEVATSGTDLSPDDKFSSWFGVYDVFADKGDGLERIMYGVAEVAPQVTEG